jgi:hypothetical protein
MPPSVPQTARAQPVAVPAPPTLRPEVAARRTVRAHTDVVRAALAEARAEARAEGRIAANPWSAQVDGERYRLLVEGTTDCFLRPEEVEGLRCHDVKVDRPEPGPQLRRAEVILPLRYTSGGSSSVEVTLKHRDDGQGRFVPFKGGKAEAARWAEHIARFLPPRPVLGRSRAPPLQGGDRRSRTPSKEGLVAGRPSGGRPGDGASPMAALAGELVALDDAGEERLLWELAGLPTGQALALLASTARATDRHGKEPVVIARTVGRITSVCAVIRPEGPR